MGFEAHSAFAPRQGAGRVPEGCWMPVERYEAAAHGLRVLLHPLRPAAHPDPGPAARRTSSAGSHARRPRQGVGGPGATVIAIIFNYLCGGWAGSRLEGERRTYQAAERVMTTTHAPHSGHAHRHGEGCGHVALPHHDHVDYAHDGHLHRVHDDHVDECEQGRHIAHADHPHQHGAGCGHVAVPHGEHVDYVHEGHRHAAHDGHWDDH
ncbi:hypothetical protein GCM10009802_01740 [Streptomyces synnematoformans]|uniref:Uncharacterized protein n=2 Tax=Streptomyces synnematoformans TaxID=415721 RepID=A0ABN2X800_9ACTN